MALWLVEVRRTLEWGGYFEADSEEEAKRLATLEMSFSGADIVDEQMLCKVVETEEQTNG